MVQLGMINPGATMANLTNSLKSTTQIIYEWLVENKPTEELTTKIVSVATGVIENHVSAALFKLEAKGVVRAVGKTGRALRRVYVGPSHDITFHSSMEPHTKISRPKNHTARTYADFGQEAPSQQRPARLRHMETISPAAAPPPSMVERLLQLAIEAERIVETIPTEALINELKRRGEMK